MIPIKFDPCRITECEYNSSGKCAYQRIVGCIRPCGAGKYCDFSPLVNKRRENQGKINHSTALQLYKAGMSDRKIAEMLDVAKSSVGYWRRKNGLPPVGRRGWPPKRKEAS